MAASGSTRKTTPKPLSAQQLKLIMDLPSWTYRRQCMGGTSYWLHTGTAQPKPCRISNPQALQLKAPRSVPAPAAGISRGTSTTQTMAVLFVAVLQAAYSLGAEKGARGGVWRRVDRAPLGLTGAVVTMMVC